MIRASVWKFGASLLIASLAVRPIATSSVNVALEASFTSPPYLLELLETAAHENETAYFPLLDRIAEGYFDDDATDEELYTAFLRLLDTQGHLTSPDALSSFQFALSIRSAAPRIEAHFQYYRTSVEATLVVAQDGACPVWAHFNGKQYCSATLERAQQDFTAVSNEGDLPFDRVLGLSPDLPVSTLYADITHPSFRRFHQTLRQTAQTGQTSYRLRYRPSTTTTRPLVMSGYGVGLDLKRTDYIVIDDRDAKNPAPNSTDELEATDDDGEIELADLKPLSSSELLELGMKAASYVLEDQAPFHTLLKMTQDFPKYSSSISKRNISDALIAEHRTNRAKHLPAGHNAVWINGMQISERQMDAFSLLETMRRERSLIGSLRELGLSNREAITLISDPQIAELKTRVDVQRYDYRDATEEGRVILWLNDITKDKRYESWPTDLGMLLQRVFPGQLPSIRRDIHNVIVPLDLTDVNDVELLVETLQTFVMRQVPIRIGIVPMVRTEQMQKQAKAVAYLLDTYGLGSLFAYLAGFVQARREPTMDEAMLHAATVKRDLRKGKTEQTVSQWMESYADVVTRTQAYLRRLGVGDSKLLIVNGAVLSRNDGWMQGMSTRIDLDLRQIQQAVMEQSIEDNAWLAGRFLDGAALQRNPLIVPEDESTVRVLDLPKVIREHTSTYHNLPRIAANADALKQFWSHAIVVADLDTDAGSTLLQEAAEFRKQQPEMEIVILHNPRDSTASNHRSAGTFELFNQAKQPSIEDIVHFLAGSQSPPASSDQQHQMAATFWQETQSFAEALGLQAGQNGLIVNGRVVGPIPLDEAFNQESFTQLLSYERSKRITPANTALMALGFDEKLDSPLAAAKLTSLLALSTVSDIPEGIFDSASTLRSNVFATWQSNASTITAGNLDTAALQIVASIDPTSEIAQRWSPILKVLSELSGVHVTIFLNPRERMAELPVKRFYRHVLQSKPSFDQDGMLSRLQATFVGLPKEALLSLAMDIPPAWLVAPKACIQDLDNIKLSAYDGADVHAIYELEHVLIEGHTRDTSTGQAPRGVQLLLGTVKNLHFADTLIMANLGYFQFKANPGFWNIHLQSGRSQEIFAIESIGSDGYSDLPGDDTTSVTLMSFQGKTLYPRLSRKQGHETDDVLDDIKPAVATTYAAKAGKLASSLLARVGVASKVQHADINIFSVASGHLYERMLNIMMVSVMRHTTHTVKFWFIEQFLSPSFTQSLPMLAATYHFDYELVTYKWPHWLRGQKEKQREIWGYKILFLDVLFPLSLDKVIFVDADQIVRTDMYDLVQHDLKGAPYGFTPMCDSRTEMEGFRFWKQGYWKTYLRGLPYHISALYVVDLIRFRQMAAGDRLRQQYHQLSADPNSLANLDQDLPNHMQMAMPIHSLPQEWLWCETWCSDESLATARTIDLCNNPLTKEPKLDRARRQVPEWTTYDEEIAAVLKGAGGARAGDAGEETEGEAATEASQGVLRESDAKTRDEL